MVTKQFIWILGRIAQFFLNINILRLGAHWRELRYYSHVSVFSRLFVLLKYCGFSITGILVMPMMTASGPISDEEGVLLPLETWWRGEAESSSLLITDDGPERAERRGWAEDFSVFFASLQWSREVLMSGRRIEPLQYMPAALIV